MLGIDKGVWLVVGVGFIVIGLFGTFFFGHFGILHVMMGAGILVALLIQRKRATS